MIKISVLPIPNAHVLNIEALDNKQVRYVGKTYQKGEHVLLQDAVTLDVSKPKYRNYYLNALRAGDLLPADDFTKTLLGK